MLQNYPIRTAWLHLRPFRDRDLYDLYEFHSLPEVVRFLYWNVRSLEETKQALERKNAEVSLKQQKPCWRQVLKNSIYIESMDAVIPAIFLHTS